MLEAAIRGNQCAPDVEQLLNELEAPLGELLDALACQLGETANA